MTNNIKKGNQSRERIEGHYLIGFVCVDLNEIEGNLKKKETETKELIETKAGLPCNCRILVGGGFQTNVVNYDDDRESERKKHRKLL